jgi:16S rRNA (guanine1207-N2)-methyltransferase
MRNERDLSLPTQLLFKNLELIQANNLLVIGAFEVEALLALKSVAKKITLFNFDYAKHQELIRDSGSSENMQFGAWYKPVEKHDGVVVYLPKSEHLIRMVFSMVSDVTEKGGNVYVVGQKTEGIKSQGPTIEEFIGNIKSSESARHSTLYQATMQKPPQGKILSEWAQEFAFDLNGQSYKAVSLPGVFSYGRLDEGTRILLDNAQVDDGVKVLDWGCGSGVIGLVLKKTLPNLSVDMVDSNALAVEAAKMTMSRNNLSSDRIWVSDVFSEVSDTYDLIISNPPFHSGVKTKYSMVEDFIEQARQRLKPQGKLVLVANSFLRYKPLISQSFGHCKIIAESPAYKVYEAVNLTKEK